MIDKKLMRIEGLAVYLDTPVPTIYMWTHQKKIPHLKIGRSVRFDRVEIDEWLEKRKIAPESALQRTIAEN